MAAKHAQGELVDPRLQHGPKLPLEIGGLVLLEVTVPVFALRVGVQQAIGISSVVVIVSVDQGEECLRQVTAIVCLRGGCSRGTYPLGAAPPSGEAEAAPALELGRLWLMSRALTDASLLVCTPGGTRHFRTLHFKPGKVTGALSL